MAATVTSIAVRQWYCRRLQGKREVLQHIEHAGHKLDIILLQETLTATPSLPGYRVQTGQPGGQGLCTFVRKGITMVWHKITRVEMEHSFSEIVIGRDTKQSVFVLNIYSNPSQTQQRFKTILQKASMAAGNAKLLVCGDFNAIDQSCGYVRSNAKVRNLAQEALDIGYVLITDPANPTRIGNSVYRDTTPHLTFT